MVSGKRNYLKGVIMSHQSNSCRRRCTTSTALLIATMLFTGVSNAAAGSFSSSRTYEVAPVYKANRVAELNLAAYKDELVDCSALAGIHTWIGDDLNTAGAEVRQVLNNDYWVSISKAYLTLAQQASGTPDLSKEMGARMRVIAADYRDLTTTSASTANWSSWYDLIDRCDSWRPAKPARAFYNNKRPPPVKVKQSSEVARAPY